MINELDVCFFLGLPHPHGKRNTARFGLLTWTTLRVNYDGLAQIQPLTEIVSVNQRSTVIHLKVDVYAERNESRSLPLSATVPSSIIQGDTRAKKSNQQLLKPNSIR